MEVDIVDNHDDLKLPILDMKCWLDSEGFAQYMHYEKPVSSKLVISERSAHANGCRSVHMNELDRRMSNTSQGPNWEEKVEPSLSDYMSRMKAAGYSENYRKNVLKSAFAIHDSKIRKANAGEVPLNRPAGYRKLERRKEKKEKKKNWSSKGGNLAPIIVQSTPGGSKLEG